MELEFTNFARALQGVKYAEYLGLEYVLATANGWLTYGEKPQRVWTLRLPQVKEEE